jgi:hypothetical protein
MEFLLRDLRFGARQLLKDKGFTTTALATLALCIGANAAVYTVVNAILLQPLPVPESDRILLMYNSYPKGYASHCTSLVGLEADRRFRFADWIPFHL